MGLSYKYTVSLEFTRSSYFHLNTNDLFFDSTLKLGCDKIAHTKAPIPGVKERQQLIFLRAEFRH
jgi:hypothetical protein